MIIILGERNGKPGGTYEIEEGDAVTPALLLARGYHFPRATLRYTFPKGRHYSASNGAPLVTVERNSDWGGNWLAPKGAPINP